MARARITDRGLRDYVVRLGDQHPPIEIDSVD